MLEVVERWVRDYRGWGGGSGALDAQFDRSKVNYSRVVVYKTAKINFKGKIVTYP